MISISLKLEPLTKDAFSPFGDVIDIEHEHKVSNHSCVIHETSVQILCKFDLGIDGISCIPLKK